MNYVHITFVNRDGLVQEMKPPLEFRDPVEGCDFISKLKAQFRPVNKDAQTEVRVRITFAPVKTVPLCEAL